MHDISKSAGRNAEVTRRPERFRTALQGILGYVREVAFGNEIAVRDVGLVDGLAEFFGAVNVAGDFEAVFGFAFEAFGIVFRAEFASGVVAVFLETVELTREPAENVNGGREFLGVGSELFADVRLKEELRELGGGELETNFGELGGIGGAEMFNEVVLEEAGFQGAVLLAAPIAIAATGFPVGNIALGNGDAVFVERADNFGMGDVVAEHAVDHVADGMGKASDFAVAGFWPGGAGNWLMVES